jgi:transposase-like protein
MDVEERVFDDDEKQRAWLEGCRREEAISGLLERHGDKRLSIEDVDEVAWELGVSRATLYRLIAAFRANRTVSSVEPRRRGLVAWRLCETRLDVGAVSIMPPERVSLARVRSSG